MNSLFTTVAYASEAEDAANAVDQIAKSIDTYGPLIVLSAIFFFLFMVLVIAMIYINHKMIKRISDTNTKQTTTEEGLLKKFVDAALSELTSDDDITEAISDKIKPLENAIKDLQKDAKHDKKDNNDDDYHKDLVGAYIDVNMTFKDASRIALKNLNCDRIGIYVFHNGNESMLGLPFFKMTCVHEWTPSGSNTLRGKSHCNMPLHLFNDFIEDLWNYGFYRSENIEKTALIDPSIKEFVSFSKTQALYIMAVKDSNNDAITGFVVAEFNQPDTFEHDDTRNNKIKETLSNMIAIVSPILSNRYKYKKEK